MSATRALARQPSATPVDAPFFGGRVTGLWTVLSRALKHPVATSMAASEAARRRLADAARVRALADRVRHSDPSFASDLYAAALRHESVGEQAA